MAATPRGEQLTVAYQAALAALGERLARRLSSAWSTVRDDDDETLRRWLAVVVPSVLGSQTASVALTAAHLTAYTAAEGQPIRNGGLRPDPFIGAALRGVPIEAIYARPFAAARRVAEEDNRPLRSALTAEGARVVATAATDVQLAARAARVGWANTTPLVVGWRRSLGRGRHCALCQSASGAVYDRQMLMPIHQHCQCVAEPVLAAEPRQRTAPPVTVIDSPELRDAAEAGQAVARIENHGELGPVLVAVGREFSREG